MNPSDSEMSLNFGSKARVFSEMPNLNNKLCRESETMVKVDIAKNHLRDNEGPADPVYHDVHHPLCYCEEFQQKVYTSE